MTKFPSQKKFENLVKELLSSNVESSSIDAKSTLNLKEMGDKATLIRHVSAIANTGQDGYLLIGMEDKTWNVVGIPEDSPLMNADQSQKQINQILDGRVDPAITIGYRTYPYKNYRLGIVQIPAGKPPYIISIADDRFGGLKSDSTRESYIYRGVIYIRRGSDSVIANHQSEIFSVLEGRIDFMAIFGSLGLISVVVSVGIGIGVTTMNFVDVYVPSILGGAWGLFVGILLNNRVKDAIGRFPKNLFSSIFRSSVGPLLGLIVGSWLGFHLARVILSMGTKPLEPVSMGLIIAPVVLIMGLGLPLIIFLAINYLPVDNLIAKIRGYVDRK